ncbi:GAF and ANTAR domain-containing protein [Arthrobacter sp. FW306-07-I]|uniref:GAF and ANTAR domain-containing protein n=1 Tax=Arthrobacter sp. FW306-07-I TaxID=2879622 RepID=UPI001F44007B|nr:GAF and ANTAR domain-containing protein [Arthrobacter sp. FW306-07-I]UKA74903.1 GAF and ANTAR domain-containing protein [Arthrobacter sp. FW306-07-I]
MLSSSDHESVQVLQSILVGSENGVEFLSGLSSLAAAAVSEAAGDTIECAVTLKMRRKPATAAGSSARAIEIDHIEQELGDGPCVRALREMAPVIIDDVDRDPRWLPLNQKLAEYNVHSTLGVPLEITDDARAALNFFATKPGVFTADVYDKAVGFAAAAHNTLNLSVRINNAQSRADDLEAAMQSRTAINLACGVIMAQNRCSQEEAMEILTKVSSNRNRKLRDVASELIEQLSGSSARTHFDG